MRWVTQRNSLCPNVTRCLIFFSRYRPSHIHLIPSTCFRFPLNIHHFKVPTRTLPPTHSQTCPLAPLARSVMTWSRLMSSAAAKFRGHDLRSQGQSLAWNARRPMASWTLRIYGNSPSWWLVHVWLPCFMMFFFGWPCWKPSFWMEKVHLCPSLTANDWWLTHG